MEPQTVGSRVLELLEQRGWSQAQLARRIGIERSHLSRLMRGKRQWKPEQLERVAGAFEVELGELVQGTEAEGLPEATEDAHAAVEQLTERLAGEAAENTALKAKLLTLETETRALRKERDAARTELLQAQQELRNRPTQSAFEDVWAERDASIERAAGLEHQVAEAKRRAGALHKQTVSLQVALKQAQEQSAINYQACEYWRKQAEERGARFKGVAALAAGVGLVSLLGRGGSDDDDDDYED